MNKKLSWYEITGELIRVSEWVKKYRQDLRLDYGEIDQFIGKEEDWALYFVQLWAIRENLA